MANSFLIRLDLIDLIESYHRSIKNHQIKLIVDFNVLQLQKFKFCSLSIDKQVNKLHAELGFPK